MRNFDGRHWRPLTLRFAGGLALVGAVVSPAPARAQTPGFAVERLYQSAPGGGWFVMDDLNIDGGWGVAASVTSGFARLPLNVTTPNAPASLAVVSEQAFLDVGVAVTHSRYRWYFNVPMPLRVSGVDGIVGPYQFVAPSVDLGSHPDAVVDPRLGFDVRLRGQPGERLRLGAGAQVILPSGEQADYVTDGSARGMLRFLVAGDHRSLSYAGHVGFQIRSLNTAGLPDGPVGNEWLFGVSVGRRLSLSDAWSMTVGPEVFGETAAQDLLGAHTGVEGLVTTRFEHPSDSRALRLKVGAGCGLHAQFGAPKWRVVLGAELLGRQSTPK
jgi:hypothetical protein